MMGDFLRKSATLAALLALTTTMASAQGRLRGTVYDSVASRPLASAFVQLAMVQDPAISRSIRTDDQGRFILDSMPPGTWAVVVMHPRLDSLGIEQLSRSVSTTGTGEQRVTLAVPSPRVLVRTVCGDAVPGEDTGFLHGRLRRLVGSAASNGPRDTADHSAGQVDVQWVDLTIAVADGLGVQRTPRRLTVAARTDGSYTACGVPAGGTVRVRGISGTDTTGTVEMVVADHGMAKLDLTVGPVRHVIEAATDSMSDAAPKRRGDGVLQGRVVGPGNNPLPDVSVVVWGSDRTARSDASGAWQLRDLPEGTHTVEVRALGFRASRLLVDIADQPQTVLETTLERVVTLDTVRTRAMRDLLFVPELRAFDERRRQYPGYFRGPDEIDRIQPFEASDIFMAMPGIRLEHRREGTAILMRGKAGFPCVPDVFIDRMRIIPSMGRGMIDEWVYARTIRAVEVYPGLTSPPPEFMRVGNECGTIVIWTGRL
jgi:hypothetical protein